jgi:hypothetical protein
MQKKTLNMELILAIRGPCNYSCEYCVGHNWRDQTAKYSLPRLREVYDRIGGFIVTSLECGAGEPTIHPQIRDILEIATQHGVVSVPTNNSVPPSRWLPADSRNVLIRAALHPQGEDRLRSFVDHLLYARDTGARCLVVFVAHPSRFHKLNKYCELFQEHGFDVYAAAFDGIYQGRKYPNAFTDAERKKLCLINEKKPGLYWIPHWYLRLVPEMTIRSFSKIPCRAGYTSLFVGANLELHRCLYDHSPLQTPYSGPVPCKVRECGCGLLLEELNTQDPSFWNYYRELARLPLLPDQPQDPEQTYQGRRALYWDLLKRYGKLSWKHQTSETLYRSFTAQKHKLVILRSLRDAILKPSGDEQATNPYQR